MKTPMANLLGAVSVLAALSAHAQEPVTPGQPASFIPMPAAEGQADPFADYLEDAAGIVRRTEPGTTYWFGLRDGDTVAIFDVFADESARRAHFDGRVAEQIAANAGDWVADGWHGGVLPNVTDGTILSARRPVDLGSATTATHIALRAAPGQADALAELLGAGGAIVEATEPGTLFWVALRYDAERFGIFDVFADEDGRAAHFAGEVAALLKRQAATLVAGGWDDGVVANIRDFDVVAMK